MTTTAPQGGPCPSEIQLLTFTLAGLKMAADTDQIAEMVDMDKANAMGLPVRTMHDIIRLRMPEAGYRSPRVLVLKNMSSGCGVVIDQPDEVITVPVGSIRPMPQLISRGAAAGPVWGAIVREDDVLLLVDLLKTGLP